MIEADRISKSFGRVRAVRDVSFAINPGQVAGLLGANGAGKTTTLRILTGYLPPDAGRAKIAGFDTISQSQDARRAIGYLPESAPAYAEMRTKDYLDFRGRLFQLPRPQRLKAIDHVIERCQLQDVRKRRVGKLSKGYRQRVGLAAALLHDPAVLVLDEPTNGLDPAQIREARSLIRDLAQERTVIVSSHILPEIELTCDRVVIMARGRVRADGLVKDLVADHTNAPYIAELRPLGPDPIAPDAVLRDIPGVASLQTQPPQNDTWTRIRILPHPGAGDLREPIAAAAAQHKLLVRELAREPMTLERLFLEIMQTDDEPDTKPHATPARGGRS